MFKAMSNENFAIPGFQVGSRSGRITAIRTKLIFRRRRIGYGLPYSGCEWKGRYHVLICNRVGYQNGTSPSRDSIIGPAWIRTGNTWKQENSIRLRSVRGENALLSMRWLFGSPSKAIIEPF
jgi:hypothetical protein